MLGRRIHGAAVGLSTAVAAGFIVGATFHRLSESGKTRNRRVAGLGRDPSLSRLQLT
jgi:hypothetical protein